MSRNRTYMIGRTKVFVDSHGDPYRLERDGGVVDCACDEAAGLVCAYHAARVVPDVLTQLDQVLAAVEQREARGHWEPSPTRFGVVRCTLFPALSSPKRRRAGPRALR